MMAMTTAELRWWLWWFRWLVWLDVWTDESDDGGVGSPLGLNRPFRRFRLGCMMVMDLTIETEQHGCETRGFHIQWGL